jgi:hypothetical protein
MVCDVDGGPIHGTVGVADTSGVTIGAIGVLPEALNAANLVVVGAVYHTTHQIIAAQAGGLVHETAIKDL